MGQGNVDTAREQLDDRLYEGRYGGPDVCPQCNRNYGTTEEHVCSETMDYCDEACSVAIESYLEGMTIFQRMAAFFKNWRKEAWEKCEFHRRQEVCQRCGEDMSEKGF